MPQRDIYTRAELLHLHQDGVPWARIAEHAGVSTRTLRRWQARHSQGVLDRSRRSDAGQRRTDPELVEIITALALRLPTPTTAYVWRRVGDIARDRGLNAPSYSTVRSIVTGIDPGLRVLATRGASAYRDQFELVLRRSTSRPNEQWQIDHTLLDIEVVDERGASLRPWLTVILDDYSRSVTGYVLSARTPTADQSALAFHQAASRKHHPRWIMAGLPDILYSDHGADFTSERFDRACLNLHVRLVHSRHGIPQGRGKIERFYLTLTSELLPHLPGHIPHGTGGAPVTPAALSMGQLDTVVERFIIEDYHQRIHSETAATPHDRWRDAGFIPRLPATPDDLDLLLLTADATRRVQRDGIQFASARYVSPVLAAYVGEDVTVRYDPRDLGEIRIFHDNRFLCRAIAPERASTTIAFADIKAARDHRRRALRGQLRQLDKTNAALPADNRYPISAIDTPPDPQPPAPQPTHGLRLYAADE